ncbi:MAG: hypothetical protein E6I25_08185 [Chloroflexi bacterium]|nr:MAG: hypothetical protein E6I25_08185 [Chloroflexota bacterium]
MLDDRLDGKDLEWARDHLRRCEACRERVEDFREMLLRVGRLPSATVGSAAMDQAFALAIPDRLRSQGGMRSFEVAPAPPAPVAPAPHDLPPAVRPEVSSIPDLLTELEREIFRDEPWQDHPMPLSPVPEPLYPALTERPEEIEPVEALEPAEPPLREVPVDSHQQVDFTDWDREPEPEPEPVPAPAAFEAAPVPIPVPVTSNVIFDQEPALRIDEESEAVAVTPPRKPDTAMRIAVGLGAAACVLLAAVLYEGGLLKTPQKVSSTAATVTQSIHPSATARASASPSASPAASASASVSASTAPVLYTLGNGVSGGTMFRIRPGTAVAGYTRLVFDMHGNGLPTMIITRPDDLHVVVTFKDTNVAGAPVNGIRSYHVTAVEPGVQQGADGSITIDLARPVRVTAFTLAATGGYAWRLVVDLHTS